MNASAFNPYALLLQKGLLRENERLTLRHTLDLGTMPLPEATVARDGLIVDGEPARISPAANRILHAGGYPYPANGWLLWFNDNGQSLASLYRRAVGFPEAREKGDKAEEIREFSHRYRPTRDVTFVFGAGVSISDGAPLQKDLLRMIFSADEACPLTGDVQSSVREFVDQYFVCDAHAGQFPSLEEVFGFIDYFISMHESLNRVYTVDVLESLRQYLIRLIYAAIHQSTHRSSDTLQRFWHQLFCTTSNASIVSLNYDTLAEDAFAYLFPLDAFFDYCYELANYDYDAVPDVDQWINPRNPVLTTAANPPVSYKMIKVHGSLNWRYCNCCNHLLVKPWNRSMGLEALTTKKAKGTGALVCPYDGNQLDILITPPSHIKDLNHPVTSRMLIELSDEIRKSRNVVFVGYSLPEADVHIRSVLAKSGIGKKRVIVVDPYPNQAMRQRYVGVAPNCRFYEKSLAEFIADEALFQDAILGS